MAGRRLIVVFPPRRDRGGLRTERLTCERLESRQVLATFHVSVGGDDLANGSEAAPFRSIQRGLDAALEPGDTVLVHKGRYAERVAFRAGGSARGGPITLAASPGARPVIDVGGLADGGENVVTIRDLGHVVVRGLEIVGNETREGGAAVWVSGAGAGIEIRDNLIHDLRGVSSMGIGVFGTRRVPIRNLTVAGNVIHDGAVAPSEALVVSGNVAAFRIADNHVHDVDNIGIDIIGGERDVHRSAVPRDGVVVGNLVERARSSYGGGFAAGIYVDGARRIRITGNTCVGNDLGIEVGAEHRGFDAVRVTVTGNTLRANEKAGLVFGGYGPGVGRTRLSTFAGNVIAGNDTLGTGHGQVWIQYASDNTVRDNDVESSADGRLLTVEPAARRNRLEDQRYRLGTGAVAPIFQWRGRTFASLAAFTVASGQDRRSTVSSAD